MRAAILIGLMLTAGCGVKISGNAATADAQRGSPAPGQVAAAATIAVGASEPCSVTWDGAAISRPDMVSRATQLLVDRVSAASGPGSMEDMDLPTLRLTAPLCTRFGCISQVLGDLARIGNVRVALGDGTGGQDAIAHLFLPDQPVYAPRAAVRLGSGERTLVGTGARILEESEEVQPAQVGRRLASFARAVPTDVIMVPSGDTHYNAILAAARSLADSRVAFTLSACRLREAEGAPMPGEQIGAPIPLCTPGAASYGAAPTR